LKPGDTIGDWIVVRTLGKGGMGTVFLGHDHSDESDLAALKIFPAWNADDDGFKRFRRECDVLGRLRHRGIVPLKDGTVAFGRDPATGIPWLAMEYVDGPSLEARLDHGPLPAGYAASAFDTLADAMDYAHAQGVFHRDVKPANIVLGADGVRLVDFGIALADEKTRLTAVGTFAGTLAYMAPEVVVDDRTTPDPVLGDIYAMAVVLYESLTATRAFSTPPGLAERDRQVRILKMKMNTAFLDPGEGVPAPLRELVKRATAARPDERVQTWAEFRSWLQQVPFGHDIPVVVDMSASINTSSDMEEYPENVTGYRRRVARPERGLRLGRRPNYPAGPTTDSGVVLPSVAAAPAPVAPVAVAPVVVAPVVAPAPIPAPPGAPAPLPPPAAAAEVPRSFMAYDDLDSGFHDLPAQDDQTEATSADGPLSAAPAPVRPAPPPARAPVVPPPAPPPPFAAASPASPASPVTPSAPPSAAPRAAASVEAAPPLAARPGAFPQSPRWEDMPTVQGAPLPDLDFADDPEPPPASPPVEAANRPVITRGAAPAKPAQAPAPKPVAAPVVTAPKPAPPPVAVAVANPPAPPKKDEEDRKMGLLLPLLGLLVVGMLLVGVGGLYLSGAFGGSDRGVTIAGNTASAPGGGTPGGSAKPGDVGASGGGASGGGASGGGAGASGGAAGGAEAEDDGLAWHDTGLKQERVAWRAGGAAAGVQGDPARGAATARGEKAGGGAPAAGGDRTRSSEIKVFFTSAGDAPADVYLNGRRRGTTPLALQLEPMEYELEFAAKDARSGRTIEVKTYGANEFRFDAVKRKINAVQR
jgi:serine/threonine protein kinase